MPQQATLTTAPAALPRQSSRPDPAVAPVSSAAWLAAVATCWDCGAPGDRPHTRGCRDRFDDHEA